MTREEASFYLANMDRKYMEEGMSEALDKAIISLHQINKIADLVDGTIDHFDLDDAMDMLYEIKGVIECRW